MAAVVNESRLRSFFIYNPELGPKEGTVSRMLSVAASPIHTSLHKERYLALVLIVGGLVSSGRGHTFALLNRSVRLPCHFPFKTP